MTQSTYMLIAAVFGAVATVALAACWQSRTPEQNPEPPATAIPPAVYAPCHSPVCAHMTTPHDPTPIGGLACRSCGTVTTPASNGDH